MNGDRFDALPSHPRRTERGSAYLVALALLFLVTAIGLAVSTISQIEGRASGQQRIAARTLYAAEAGTQVALARLLARGDFSPTRHFAERNELEGRRIARVRDEIVGSRLWCVASFPCNLCAINQGRRRLRRQHQVTVTAVRESVAPDGERAELARRTLTWTVDVEPVEESLTCVPAAAPEPVP